MIQSSSLSKCLVTSSRLVKIMEWNQKSRHLMALDITRDRIGIALTDAIEKKILKLDAIPYLINCKQGLKEQNVRVGKEIEKILKNYDICGFLVGWPLEPSGSPGASCGRVLHLLDYLAEKDRMVSRTRPLALWDERIFTHNQFEELRMPTDSWGRSSRYSRELEMITGQDSGYYKCASSFLEHPASTDSTSASLILQQFLENNWKGNKSEVMVHVGQSNYNDTLEQSNDQMARSI